MRFAVLLAAMVVVSGCGGSADAPYEISLTAAEVRNMGANLTGRIDIGETDWMAIATRACNEGARDWDVAKRIFDQEIGEMNQTGSWGGAQSVWLLLTGACHELIPQEAIDRGPPPPDW